MIRGIIKFKCVIDFCSFKYYRFSVNFCDKI